MPKWNLHYRRKKLSSNNFKPVIDYKLGLLEPEPLEEYHPPIEEFGEVRDEYKEDLIILDNDEEEQPQTALLLEELIKELKKKRSIRTLELWITQNRKRVNELNIGDRNEFLDYINGKFYSKK